MKSKSILLFLLSSNFLFPLHVGIVGLGYSPHHACYHNPNRLTDALIKKGHTVDFVCLYSRKAPKNCRGNLLENDVIINYSHPGSLDAYDVLVITDTKILNKADSKKAILIMFEPPLIIPAFASTAIYKQFKAVFSWDHAKFNGKNIQKSFYFAYDNLIPSFIPFHERKFSCMVAGYLKSHLNKPNELYSERINIAKFYDKFFPTLLTLHGHSGWDKKEITIFKGNAIDKLLVLRQHKFCYCYENSISNQYYITEKILHCLASRTVPIYKGCTNITDYIPEGAFIDANKFTSIRELHDYISNMDEETWLGYIHEIEKFDTSESCKFFKAEYNIKNMVEAIER
jgi:hypothetical protein